MLKLVSVNAWTLYDSQAQQTRYQQVHELIRSFDADVVAVQEIAARPPTTFGASEQRMLAEERVPHLAEAVGLCCEVDGDLVYALGGETLHTALLWRHDTGAASGKPKITPVPGSVRRFERVPAGMWHSMVTAVFDVDGPKLRVGSVQLSPWDQSWGCRDASHVMRAMNSDEIPGVIGGDWNGVGSTLTVLPDGVVDHYDPNPYTEAEWHPDHAYQIDDDGHLDRRVARRLEGPARFRDCARITNTPWHATTGHPTDPHPPRRIDRWYATHHLSDAAVTGYGVADPAAAFPCTDHLPVWITIDENQLLAR